MSTTQTVKTNPCEYYALCDHNADGTTDHPILGAVPTCQRCADRHDKALTPFPTDGLTCTINVSALGFCCPTCATYVETSDEGDMEPDTVAEVDATVGAIVRDEAAPVVTTKVPEWVGVPGIFRCALCSQDSYARPALLAVVVQD